MNFNALIHNSNVIMREYFHQLQGTFRVYVQHQTEDQQRGYITHSKVMRCTLDVPCNDVHVVDVDALGIFEDPQHGSLYGAIEGVAWAAQKAGWNVEYMQCLNYWDNEVTYSATIVVCTKPAPLADRLVAARAAYMNEV